MRRVSTVSHRSATMVLRHRSQVTRVWSVYERTSPKVPLKGGPSVCSSSVEVTVPRSKRTRTKRLVPTVQSSMRRRMSVRSSNRSMATIWPSRSGGTTERPSLDGSRHGVGRGGQRGPISAVGSTTMGTYASSSRVCVSAQAVTISTSEISTSQTAARITPPRRSEWPLDVRREGTGPGMSPTIVHRWTGCHRPAAPMERRSPDHPRGGRRGARP